MEADPIPIAEQVEVRPFVARDQRAVRDLVLAGLAEHWGELDPTLNPDLDDVASAYREALVLVGHLDGRVVACGALVPLADGRAEIRRMAVAADARRCGIGRLMIDHLRDAAAALGHRRLVLETTADWHPAVACYLASGFEITHRARGTFGTDDIWFALDL